MMKSKVAEDWAKNEHSDYFVPAESDLWMGVFWNPETLFYKLFSQLSVKESDLLEIASGHGRHSEKVAPLCRRFYAFDVSEANVMKTAERIRNYSNAKAILSDGMTLPEIADSSIDSLFSYDAMVHFEDFVMFSYLKEIARVLKPGGKALLHHSNFKKALAKVNYRENPSCRSPLDLQEFDAVAKANSLQVLERHLMDWNGVADLDALTLIQKL